MTTPSGTIGLSDVNVELGFPSTTSINMNQSNVRTLAGVGGSGTVISMNDLRGKSNRVAISLTISSDTTNYDVYSSRGPTYNPGKSDITVTINPGVNVYSTSTGSSAFSVPSAFTSGDTITVVNNGVIVGRGGNGGRGDTPSVNGTAGASGGPGLFVQFPTTFTNNNRVAGGGGGGGGGRYGYYNPCSDCGTAYRGGGGGGGGVASGSGGAGGVIGPPFADGSPGSSGTLTAGGGGGAGNSQSPTQGFLAGPGGPGGGYGSSGSQGSSSAGIPGQAGGASGAAVTGNPYITWPATGTRNGPIS